MLFLTPGPVWIAVLARGLSGGLYAVLPLALGVTVGDMIWPLMTIYGLSSLSSSYADLLVILRYIGAIFFVAMGVMIIANRKKALSQNEALTTPGFLAGFTTGILVIAANPKAILFYIGLMPTFFELSQLTTLDIAFIVVAWMLVPLIGNMGLALSIDRFRALVSSPTALIRLNFGAGIAMICVGLFIGFAN